MRSDSISIADDVEHQPERDVEPSSRPGSPNSQPPDAVTASDGEPTTQNSPNFVQDGERRQDGETAQDEPHQNDVAPEQPQGSQDDSSGGVPRNCKTLAFELADVVESLKDKYNIKDADYVKLPRRSLGT